MDPQLLTTVATTVAVAASAFGVLLAIDQLTIGTRLRRFADFLASAAEREPHGSPQQSVLESLQRESVARLVAGSAVPIWVMVGDLLFIGGAAVIAYSSGSRTLIGTSSLDWPTVVAFAGPIAASWGIALIPIRKLIRILHERRRMADAYLDGRLPLRPKLDILNQMEGGTRSEFRFAVLLSLALAVASFGIGGLAAHPESLTPALHFAIAGAVLFEGGIIAIRRYLAPRVGVWVHPRPPGRAGTATGASEQVEGEVVGKSG